MMRLVLINATKSGTMMNELVVDDLMRESILVPSLPEQRAVGALFSRLDSLIALHQRKHNQLSVLKGSLLEGMFPKPGSDVPELRFSGFADPWEQRKLGDLYRKCTEKNDGTYNTNSIISVAGMSYSPETRVTEQSYLVERFINNGPHTPSCEIMGRAQEREEGASHGCDHHMPGARRG